jgi:hypothetical protein
MKSNITCDDFYTGRYEVSYRQVLPVDRGEGTMISYCLALQKNG